MRTPTPADLLKAWLSRNRRLFRTDADFAWACGCSAGRLSQVLSGNGGRVSPDLARAFHRETRAAVPGNLWRPDLWRRPADVPHLPRLEAAQ